MSEIQKSVTFESGEDMSRLLMCDGAEKWRFLCFRRDDVTALFSFIVPEFVSGREVQSRRRSPLKGKSRASQF